MGPRTQTQYYIVVIVTRLFIVNKASACSEYLVETVSDDRLTASSIFDVCCSADKARLHSTGWAPDPNPLFDTDPWIQVDFGQPVTIMAVVTKGFYSKNYNGYVTKYMVRYSNTTSSWSTVQYSTTNVFIGNSDHTTPVNNALPTPVVVRYLRLYPTAFFNRDILRLDVIGCYGTQTTTMVLSSPTTSTTSSKLTTTTDPTITTALSTANTKNVTLVSTLFNSSETGLCTCACVPTSVSMTPQELKTKIENIVQNLTVSKEKTSKYIRSKISAQDTRPEVVYVGSAAVTLLCLMVGLVVLPDVCTVIRFFYSMLNK